LISSGGKEKLGSISKQGNRQLRTLLVVGASSIIKQAKRGVPAAMADRIYGSQTLQTDRGRACQ
jgi:transposase